MPHAAASPPQAAHELLGYARQVLREEGEACLALGERLGENLGEDFCRAADLLARPSAGVVVSGMGKAGLIAQKVSATLASLGVPSHFLHPAEAVHGDLGRVRPSDVLLVLSASGETEEIVRLLPILAEIGVAIVAITANPTSTLARAAKITLDLGVAREACALGLAPSTSTTAMLALGDALALVVGRMKGFTAADFAKLHPAGNLGKRLAKVEDAMRPLADCRVGREDKSVREVLISLGRPGRRTGAVMVTDAAGRLTGLFTDSDLARLLERQQDAALERPLREVMTVSPTAVKAGERMEAAVRLLAQRKFSELPVVDGVGAPLGLIDVTDVVAWLPQTAREATTPPSPATTQLEQSAPFASAAGASFAAIQNPRRRAYAPADDEADRAVTLRFPGVEGELKAAEGASSSAGETDRQFHRME
jgi:arabinose-5-phosphate isomerase